MQAHRGTFLPEREGNVVTSRTLLIRHADRIETFDDSWRALDGASIFVRDNVIETIGPTADLPATADRVVDASGMLVMPGLVNTHHHFYQTLTRNVPGTQDANLFDWLVALYPVWAKLTPDAMRVSTAIALAELLKSGCTTAFDHTYVWPNGSRVDDQIEVAREMGVRFHAARGSMSLGQSKGGLPPDSMVESEDSILTDCQRVIDSHHDASRYAMTRIVVAPCSPFSVSPNLMRESAALARSKGVHLHTHLAETLDEERFCIERFDRRPVELAEDLGWVGPDVWHAHMVHPSANECSRLGSTRTGIAHCPSSNMRLASGIAPIAALRAAGVRVGLGVDGSASNDSSHLLMEARQAMLLQRVGTLDPAALGAREALWFATRGGAQVLGRDDIGYLAPGMAADIIGFRLDTLDLAGGAVHDPLASLLFCRPPDVDFAIINGHPRIEHRAFIGVDIQSLITQHNQLARKLQL
ncbi:MAG TPA: 8-oxoguanine deaminase [Verrucomicrobiae bacterium]|jgi:cytosine/adenosine deaminase-related metal-dependent hydrolase|nr:8-oxoguanine deaminase [Verrucomicrobiae bacterium]